MSGRTDIPGVKRAAVAARLIPLALEKNKRGSGGGGGGRRSTVNDIIPGVIISEMPKLRSTTLTRVDHYLEPPPPLSSRLPIACTEF